MRPVLHHFPKQRKAAPPPRETGEPFALFCCRQLPLQHSATLAQELQNDYDTKPRHLRPNPYRKSQRRPQ
jgi:hypothetical protein